jgi:serine/threonine-protein kinase
LLRPWNPNVTPEFERIVFKCLEKDAARRYATPGHLRDDLAKLNGSPRTARRAPRVAWAVTAAGVLAVLLAGWMLRPRRTVDPSVPARQKSVAVLPFVDISADKGDEYLSDGMTEELLNALARVKGLRVPARTSCFKFKGKNEDIRAIGQQLQVGAVLEGSLRKAGNQLRITAELINAADGSRLWSESYDRDMTNIFAVQSDIASRVADALRLQLIGARPRRLTKPATENVEAYRLYLLGRHHLHRATGDDVQQAINCFNQAVAKDPGYARAYFCLAYSYTQLDFTSGQPVAQTYPKAQAAALKALELDPDLAEPHLLLGWINSRMHWDWKGAEEECRRAIALEPNPAEAHALLGGVLFTCRRFDEAVTELKAARELDPLSPDISLNLGFELSYVGQADLGIELLQRQIALDPSLASGHNYLGWVYFDQRRWSEAVAEFEAGRALKGTGVWERSGLGCGYARVGRTNEAQKVLSELLDLSREGLNYYVDIAAVEHALGDDERALDSLERALAEHSSGLSALNCTRFWSDLRAHPRAQAILRKMNLVD